MINDNSFRGESHVAQQRRRDKLRNNILVTSLYPHQNDPGAGAGADLSQVRSVRNCDATMFSSEMLNFSANNHHHHQHVLLSGKSVQQHPETDQTGHSAGFPNSSHHQHNSDWFANYASVSGGVGEAFPGIYASQGGGGGGGNVYGHDHGGQSSLTHHGSEISTTQKSSYGGGEMNFSSSSSPYYNNSNVVHEGMVSQGYENNIGSLVQQSIRPTTHSSPIYRDNTDHHQSVSMIHTKPMVSSHQWNNGTHELAFSTANRDGSGIETARGLSLSLSSHQPSSEMEHVIHFGQKLGPQSLHSEEMCNNSEDSKTGCYISIGNGSGYGGNSLQGVVVGSSPYHHRRSMGPLGPFTGYATILKNSKYMRAAQQLLDEFCSVAGPRGVQTCETSGMDDSREVSISSDPINGEGEIGVIGGTSGVVSSSSLNSSCEAGGGGGEGQLGTRSCQSYHQPEFQQRKAKLLYMQEEVCRRYKQYHQQMQMVMSSFDSVAGLSSATPYTSLAVKTVSRHFRFLKGAISDQLRRISKLLGEDLLSHAGVAGLHGYEGDMAMPKFMDDQGLRKQKTSGDRLGFLEPQHHVWRPQRGLPERAVAVLRAWLFDHFLHPYPTDTDKHMLANQTGLSRNQVSNWFINARVRVWKPMVEEMHMLDTKNATDTGQDSNKSIHPKPNASSSAGHYSTHAKTSSECPTAVPISSSEPGRGYEQWAALDKRSQMNCQVPNDGNLGLMSIVPYHQSGLGAVSLTLGLRHSTEGSEQRQQQEHPLSRHYGDHMFQNYVG